MREDEREREIGRKEAKGEHLRREHGKRRSEKLRRENNIRQKNFFNNPLGMGR